MKKTVWLSKRLSELGKTKRELAQILGISPARLNDYENGIWRFQASHIKPAADFLNFDRMAFLDFISGDIKEEDLWKVQPITITEKDKVLLTAIKAMATNTQSQNSVENIQEQNEIFNR